MFHYHLIDGLFFPIEAFIYKLLMCTGQYSHANIAFT